MGGDITSFASHPTTKGLSSVTFLGGYVVSVAGVSNYVRTPIATLPAANVAVEAAAGRALI